MKTALKNSVVALVALVAFTLSTNVKANGGNEPVAMIEVKFIGNLQSQPVFQLNLANEVSDEFFITISDLQGNILYSDKVKGTSVVKKFAINTDEIGDNTLKLEVRSKNTGKKETYSINRTQSYVVEAVVTRVN